jgi:hypothetical protein
MKEGKEGGRGRRERKEGKKGGKGIREWKQGKETGKGNRETMSALQRKNTEFSKQIFPEKEYGSQSQFLHSCACERFIYFHDRSAYPDGGNM